MPKPDLTLTVFVSKRGRLRVMLSRPVLAGFTLMAQAIEGAFEAIGRGSPPVFLGAVTRQEGHRTWQQRIAPGIDHGRLIARMARELESVAQIKAKQPFSVETIGASVRARPSETRLSALKRKRDVARNRVQTARERLQDARQRLRARKASLARAEAAYRRELRGAK